MTRECFNELVSEITGTLFSYAYRILRNRDDSEDAVQEVLLKIWNMGKRSDKYASIKALSMTMTRNHCIDRLRKYKNNEAGKQIEDILYLEPGPSPLEQIEIKETGVILKEIINGLPENYRELIQLREIRGLEYEEIAELTGMKINAIRVALSRARKIIRNEFIKYQDEK
jgi:RNA polymerase sigma-70 factor (ECF subfamily)